MTRSGRKITPREWKNFFIDAGNYETLSASLFQAGIKINNLKEFMQSTFADVEAPEVTSEYIVGVLLARGEIALDKVTGLWLPFYGIGQSDSYGFYKKYRLVGVSGTYERTRNEIFIFRANAKSMPFMPYIKLKCANIASFDAAISQNLDAIKEATVIITEDEELAKKVSDANEKRIQGHSVIHLPRSASRLNELTVFKTGATYLIDKLQDARRAEYVELMHIVGVRTPIEKSERLITSEVETQNSEADAYISVLIRTFNQDAERETVNLKAVFEPLRNAEYDTSTNTSQSNNGAEKQNNEV